MAHFFFMKCESVVTGHNTQIKLSLHLFLLPIGSILLLRVVEAEMVVVVAVTVVVVAVVVVAVVVMALATIKIKAKMVAAQVVIPVEVPSLVPVHLERYSYRDR